MAEPYGALVAAQLRSITGSPRLFALRCGGDVLIVTIEALAAVVLASRFGTIAGWTGAEVAMLMGVARAGEGLSSVFGRGIDPIAFSDKVRRGDFDQVLIRPVRPLVWLMTADVEARFVFRVAAAIAVLAWASTRAGVAATPANVGLLVAAVVACTVFHFATLLFGAALTFRTVEGSDIANLLANGGLGVVSFPLEVYASPLRFAFTFLVPIGLCVYVPVVTVLGRDGAGSLGPAMLVALPAVVGAYAGLAALAWRAGVHRYESTGS